MVQMEAVMEQSLGGRAGNGVVEVILILVGILTPYYGGSIKCIT